MKKLFSIGVLVVIGLFVFTACEKMGEDVGRHKGHKYVDLTLSVFSLSAYTGVVLNP